MWAGQGSEYPRGRARGACHAHGRASRWILSATAIGVQPSSRAAPLTGLQSCASTLRLVTAMTEKLWETALGISTPWYVAGAEFSAPARTLTIRVDFTAGSRFAVPGAVG